MQRSLIGRINKDFPDLVPGNAIQCNDGGATPNTGASVGGLSHIGETSLTVSWFMNCYNFPSVPWVGGGCEFFLNSSERIICMTYSNLFFVRLATAGGIWEWTTPSTLWHGGSLTEVFRGVMVVFDTSSPTKEGMCKIYRDGETELAANYYSEPIVAAKPTVLPSINRINVGRINNATYSTANTNMTHLAIHYGHLGTQREARNLWNKGNGADYQTVVGDPTYFYKFNESDGATTFVDHMGIANLNWVGVATPPTMAPFTI